MKRRRLRKPVWYYDEITSAKHFERFDLPRFDKGTMYEGMEANRHYTLEELGL